MMNTGPTWNKESDMSGSAAEFFERWPDEVRRMKESAPAVVRGFGGLFSAVMSEGALSVREKELIALGIALAERCTPCINLHVEKCLKAGATREQILEAAGVTVMMRGGPAYTYLPEVLHALEHLEQKV